jgi:hypothetical protein
MGEQRYISPFLTSALDGGHKSASRPCRLIPGERSTGTHFIGRMGDGRAGLDVMKRRKILSMPGTEPPSLYQLSCPGSIQGVSKLNGKTLGSNSSYREKKQSV